MLTCETISLYIGEEHICGAPATHLFDGHKCTGYPVCDECTKNIHPMRCRRIENAPLLK